MAVGRQLLDEALDGPDVVRGNRWHLVDEPIEHDDRRLLGEVRMVPSSSRDEVSTTPSTVGNRRSTTARSVRSDSCVSTSSMV
jgi:hypothetical protein